MGMVKKFFALLVGLLLGTSPALAQTSNGWSLQCNTDGQCQILSEVSDNNILSQIVLDMRANAPFIRILTPLGIDLNTPLGMKIDEREILEIKPTTCEPIGCLFEFYPRQDTIDALKKGQKVGLMLVTARTRDVLTMSHSLQGFSANFNSIQLLSQQGQK